MNEGDVIPVEAMLDEQLSFKLSVHLYHVCVNKEVT